MWRQVLVEWPIDVARVKGRKRGPIGARNCGKEPRRRRRERRRRKGHKEKKSRALLCEVTLTNVKREQKSLGGEDRMNGEPLSVSLGVYFCLVLTCQQELS